MARIDWQYSSIDKAAKILFEINPLHRKSADEIKNYIIGMATTYAMNSDKTNPPTFTGTAGFYVSFFPAESPDYDYGVEVTLMPYTVEQYLKSKGLM